MKNIVDKICEMDKTSKNIFKGMKLYLLTLSLIISKNELDNYINRQNLQPSVNINIQNEKQILPEENFIKERESYLSIKKFECEKIIEKYCNIYGIKKDIVMDIVSEYSDSFISYEFQVNKDIFCTGEKYDSFDYQILMLVHELYAKPYNYGYKSEDVKCDYNIDELNDTTIKEYVYEISDILGIDKDIALAIACAESYFFEAGIATNNNNPFAMNSSNGFRCFENIYLGTAEGLINLKTGYPSLNIYSMAPIYCPPNPEHWISLVNGVKSELDNGRKLYDEQTLELVLNK